MGMSIADMIFPISPMAPTYCSRLVDDSSIAIAK